MKKWFPKAPRGAYRMDMSADGRYVYALTQTVQVFDRVTGGKQRLPLLGSSAPVASPCGRFMAAAHPCPTAQNQLEISLWEVGQTHVERAVRPRVPGSIPPASPCFTADGAYFLLDTQPYDRRHKRSLSQLWAVSTQTGSVQMVYEAPEDMYIGCVSAGPRGVLVALQGYMWAGLHEKCMLLWFRDVTLPPRRILIDPAPLKPGAPLARSVLTVCWQPGGRALLMWTRRRTRLQRIDPETEDRIIPAAEHTLPWGSTDMMLSPDGRYAVLTEPLNGQYTPQVGDERPAVLVLRTSDWKLTWSRNSGFLWDARFSPDGKWLLISGDEAWCVPVSELDKGQ